MKIKNIMYEITRKLKGSYKCAIENGLNIEEGVSVMGGCNFGSEPYLITLKQKCRISDGVFFITHDGGTWAFRNTWGEYKDVIKYGRIVVGENSFIGAKSIIMPGVKIGKNCVVGAGSIVTKDVPDESVVCGNPAKIVCSTKEYAEKCKNNMISNFDFDAYEKDKKRYLLSIME